MSAQKPDRKTALSAEARGLSCVASVNAMSLTLDNNARWTLSWFCHRVKLSVAPARKPLCAAITGSVCMANVSAREEKTQTNVIPESTVSAVTLTVRTPVAGNVVFYLILLVLNYHW